MARVKLQMAAMPEHNPSIPSIRLSVLVIPTNQKTVMKIDTTNGNDEIVKQTINNEETKLLIEDEKEIKNDNQKVAIIKPSKEPIKLEAAVPVESALIAFGC